MGGGSTFCLARFQCREREGMQAREWNGEENREQESGLIFLTHTACRRCLGSAEDKGRNKMEYPQTIYDLVYRGFCFHMS